MSVRLLIIILFGTSVVYGQDSQSFKALHNFDEVVGIENTGLYTGKLWNLQYRTINEKTPYFDSPRFEEGSVTYRGQDYNGLLLKYDVFEDVVLLKLASSVGGATMEFISDWLTRFTINGHRFINLKANGNSELGHSGFYEVLYEGKSISVFTKYSKQIHQRKDRSSIYYEFGSGPSIHVIMHQNHITPVSSKKDWIKVFPQFEKQITDFYKKNRNIEKQSPNNFLTSLTNYLDVQLTNP